MITTATEDELAAILRLANDCLADVPVTVLGSGASCAHGISGMWALSQYLIEKVEPLADDAETWDQFKEKLEANNDLEEALQAVAVSSELLQEIVKHTHKLILEDELPIYQRLVSGDLRLGLSSLFEHMFNSTHKVIDVVTTNYDRIAEHAASHAKLRYNTGFSEGTIRQFTGGRSEPKHYSTHANFRCVDISKVHGSVDWFKDSLGNPVGLIDHSMPTCSPLIVTPGTDKYSVTHQEPFRSIITSADAALCSARGFLCVGYGFNDKHIEPKLIQRSAAIQCPVLILARTLRQGAKDFLAEHMHSKVLVFEKCDGGTRAISSNAIDGVLIENEDLWDLEALLKKLGIMG